MPSMHQLPVSYDWPIVALSLFVACLSAYTALDLTGPAANAATPRRRLAWTFAGTAALAMGVWAMHFIGMQAFDVPVPLEYNILIVGASFVLAFAGAMVSLWWLVRGDARRPALIRSSLLLGVCLAGMHYMGMAALSMQAVVTYDLGWVATSVLIAIVTSYAAFRLAGAFSANSDLRRFGPKALTSLALGLAIVSVHYTGMAAAHFYRIGAAVPIGPDVSQNALALMVAAASVVILGLFLASGSINHFNRERSREQSRFRMLAASAPNLMWTLDPDGSTIEFANERSTAYFGDRAASPRAPFVALLHPEDRESIEQRWDSARHARELFNEELRLRRSDGEWRWHMVQMLPTHDEFGGMHGWIASATDVHEQKQAHITAKFLDEATHALNSSLDLHAGLNEVASLLCRHCDWAEIQYDDAAGTRQSITCGDLSGALLGRLWRTEIRDGDREVGRLTIVRAAPDGAFSTFEAALFEHMGLRIGAAIAHANLYERERRVAQSFQRASLPMRLPEIAGLAFDAVYIPGRDEATVGGDWYDAVRLLDGRVVISIGDVAGSGLEAAVTMGNVRQIIRGIAQVHADPCLMLDAADRALRIDDYDKFVTAFVGVLDPVSMTLTYASAGHPPPLVRHRDGTVEALTDGGLPLGLRLSGRTTSRAINLERGSSLLLYTDGLTENSRTPIEGESELVALLASERVALSQYPARAIRRGILERSDPHDDVAILVVTLNAAADQPSDVRWTVDVTDEAAMRSARHRFAGELIDHGLDARDVSCAEIVFGELLGNTVRYAPGAVDVIVDFSGSSPVLHVLDRGPGFQYIAMLPADVFSESGRGLYIISQLTRDSRVSKRAGGGSHARVVLMLSNQELDNPPAASLTETLVRS